MHPVHPSAVQDREFWKRFPKCQFKNLENEAGPTTVLGMFGRSWEELCETWTPVIISWNPDRVAYGSSVYILVVSPTNTFAEVHGSTRSEPGFDGSWSPELISSDEMEVVLMDGWLRASEDNPLRELRDQAAQAMGLDLKKIDKKKASRDKILGRTVEDTVRSKPRKSMR